MKTTAAHNGLVLLYHSVGPAALPDSIHHVDTKVLDQHLSVVGRFFTFVSLEEYANRKDRAGLCAVTFDDGYRNVMEHAVPVLERHGIQGTMFLNAVTLEGNWNWRDKVRAIMLHDQVDAFYQYLDIKQTNQRFYRYSKTREVNSADLDRQMDAFIAAHDVDVRSVYGGYPYLTARDLLGTLPLSIGNHSASHYLLASLQTDQQQREITLGHRALTSLPLEVSPCFSVPFGGTRDINEHTFPLLREAGYGSVLMSRQQLQSGNTVSSGLQVLERFMPRSNDICSEILAALSRS